MQIAAAENRIQDLKPPTTTQKYVFKQETPLSLINYT